jgi:voltage-gated potassium channel
MALTKQIKQGFVQFRKVFIILLMSVIAIIFGTVGYMILEGYSLIDAYYMTMITITTVGFLEVHPLSDAGRVFTTILLVSNIGIFFYGATTIVGLVIEGEFRNFYKNYNVKKKISELKDHVIVCGYGRNGKQVCLELKDDKYPYLIIEKRENIVEELKQNQNILFIDRDATEEEVLIDAGIKNAKAIITTLPEDPDNVYVVLTARELNPDITIISRASNESSVNKLKRAGANNVIMPEKIGGAHMAALVMKPDIMEFIAELTGQSSDISLTFEELSLQDISKEFVGRTIRDLDIRNKTGANIIGLRMSDGEFVINPLPETELNQNTKLIALGNSNQIVAMRKLISELK